ncbi:MAG: DUF4350 domain-containing protein [Candidatus Nezhaarchaeales archaeon]
MRGPRSSLKLMAFSALLALLTVSAISALTPPSDDLHPLNPYWNGLNDFLNITNAKAINVIETVAPQSSVIFVIGPSLNHSQDHVEALRSFVVEGGTLVIMDESGVANSLISALGLGIYIDGRPMLDAVFYHRSWVMPKVVDVEDCGVTRGVESIVLNKPSILVVKDPDAKVLAKSSSFSFLDLNGDGQPQANEPVGPFAVLAEIRCGRGRVVVLSDSSPFINSILNCGDNLKLLKNLVEGKAVYVDAAVWQTTIHSTYRAIISTIYEALSSSELKYCIAILAVTVIYTLTNRRGVTERIDEVEELMRYHPDWDERLLRALKDERDSLEP